MRKFLNLVLLMFLPVVLSACSVDPEYYDLKSPCVSADIPTSEAAVNPCNRRPANEWLS